jgi:predicted amidohydrolase
MTTMKIAQCQLPVPVDKSETIALLERTFSEIAPLGVDFVMFPEMFCCPYQVENFPRYAEEEQGPMWKACSDLARAHHVNFSAGSMPERDPSGQIYNTAYVFDRSGRQVAKHRKMHLFDIDVRGGQRFKESETLAAGNAVTTFETEFGTFGLCVCYDFRFPELGRLMALDGAQVILVPAAFNMTTGPAHWETMFRSQALNNQVFAIGTAPARDETASYISWGHSIVTDPWGQVVSQMDEKPGVCVAELNLSRVHDVREQLPLLKHLRTDVYELVRTHGA